MTPIRAIIAAIIVAVLLAAGDVAAARFSGVSVRDFPPLLALARTPFSIFCFIAAWAAIVSGVLAILAGFIAFLAEDDDPNPRLPHRGFPKGLPLALVIMSVALFWLALRCAFAPAPPAPAAVVSQLETTPPLAEAEPQPATAPDISEPQPASQLFAGSSSYEWTFMNPLVENGRPIWRGGAEPFGDDSDAGESARLLCGKAWVAVTGSSSEEGQAERNILRAAYRAERAAQRAREWIGRHPSCGPTQVLAVTLGQHEATGVEDHGEQTRYQRQILVISEDRGAASAAADPRTELQEFLDDPAKRSALYGSRRFPSEPRILSAGG